MAANVTIRNVAVFDGEGMLSGRQTVILQDGLIRSVKPTRHSIQDDGIDATTAVIDGTGHTLLPGLIDAHVHADSVSALTNCARHGVTTILDMGTLKPVSELKKLLCSADGDAASPLPTYLTAGLFACHPTSRHAKNFGLDPKQTVSTPAEATAFVAQRAATDSAYLKVIADLPGLDASTLAALASAARQSNLVSVAHAAQAASYERAATAGFDVLTHVPIDGPLRPETVEKLHAEGRVVVPTLGMMGAMAPVVQRANPAGHFSLEAAIENLGTLWKAGLRICLGTDSNDLPGITISFGESVWDEMELMTRAGMDAKGALRAATAEPADVWGLKGCGRVKERYKADLVLVEGDPVADIRAVRAVKRVWIRGFDVQDVASGVEDVKADNPDNL